MAGWGMVGVMVGWGMVRCQRTSISLAGLAHRLAAALAPAMESWPVAVACVPLLADAEVSAVAALAFLADTAVVLVA
eukprot:1308553-Amphidinium_carterae.1